MARLNIIANWMQGSGMSGGDRIFIEFSKRCASQLRINLFISSDGWKICQREGLGNFDHSLWALDEFNRYGYVASYFYRTLIGIVKAWPLRLRDNEIIYSSSDFWPDSLPAFIMKLNNRNAKWIAGFYLFASNPLQKDSPYRGKRFLIGLFYWLTQLPVYWIVKIYADAVFVTSEPDVAKFITRKRGSCKIKVIRGGVDMAPSNEYFNSAVIAVEERRYDACFIGRFHPQKGVMALINIWKLVCAKRPAAKLAMIGCGPMENEVRNKIAELGLEKNIELLGYKDGEDKYEIFKQAKVVLHPATYDSGGMAACEAMAWRMPGVSFDLESLRTYYPRGMLKVRAFDFQEFADKILFLLDDSALYNKLSEEAHAWAREWDWNRACGCFLEFVVN